VNSSRFGTLPLAAMYYSLATLLLQLSLAYIVREHRIERYYPAFSFFSYVVLVKSAVMFAIARFGTNALYQRAYYLSSTIFCALIALCVAEIYLKTFGPKIALPAWAFRNGAILLPATVASAIIAAALLGSLKGDVVAKAFWTMQQATFAASWAALVSMLFYSRRLGIIWPMRVAAIASGFVLMMSANIVSSVVIGRSGYTAAIAAAFVAQSANIFTFAWWVWRFWEKEPDPIQAMREEVDQMVEYQKKALPL
jgi:uncharacterized membrane protein YiaA